MAGLAPGLSPPLSPPLPVPLPWQVCRTGPIPPRSTSPWARCPPPSASRGASRGPPRTGPRTSTIPARRSPTLLRCKQPSRRQICRGPTRLSMGMKGTRSKRLHWDHTSTHGPVINNYRGTPRKPKRQTHARRHTAATLAPRLAAKCIQNVRLNVSTMAPRTYTLALRYAQVRRGCSYAEYCVLASIRAFGGSLANARVLPLRPVVDLRFIVLSGYFPAFRPCNWLIA
jgi:hypothetical protein